MISDRGNQHKVLTDNAAVVGPLRSCCARRRTILKASGVGKPRALEGNSTLGGSPMLAADVFGRLPKIKQTSYFQNFKMKIQ